MQTKCGFSHASMPMDTMHVERHGTCAVISHDMLLSMTWQKIKMSYACIRQDPQP